MKRILALTAMGLMGLGAVSFAQENPVQQDETNYEQLSQDQAYSASSDFALDQNIFRPPGHGPRPGPHPGPRPGPRPGPGPHPGPHPGPRPGPRPPAFICYAQNLRGQRFAARGWERRRTQQAAMNQCFRFSNRCRPLGCQRY